MNLLQQSCDQVDVSKFKKFDPTLKFFNCAIEYSERTDELTKKLSSESTKNCTELE